MPLHHGLLDEERIEAIAAGFHRLSGARGAWDGRPDEDRAADRACARGVARHLALLGLGLREVAEPSEVRVVPLTPEQVEQAAVAEHERWAAFTRSRGYRPGPARDDERRTHPDLVPWDALDEATREQDRLRVRAIPSLLAEVGLELVRP